MTVSLEWCINAVQKAQLFHGESKSKLGSFTVADDEFWFKWRGHGNDWKYPINPEVGMDTCMHYGKDVMTFDIPTATFRNLVGAEISCSQAYSRKIAEENKTKCANDEEEGTSTPDFNVLDAGSGKHVFWNQFKTSNELRGHYHGIDIDPPERIKSCKPWVTQEVLQPPSQGYDFVIHQQNIFADVDDDTQNVYNGFYSPKPHYSDSSFHRLSYLPSNIEFSMLIIDVEPHGKERLIYEIMYPHLAQIHIVALSCIQYMDVKADILRRRFEEFVDQHPRIKKHFASESLKVEKWTTRTRDFYVVCEKTEALF